MKGCLRSQVTDKYMDSDFVILSKRWGVRGRVGWARVVKSASVDRRRG